MVNIKKIDEQDLVFVNKTLTAKEDKEFSDFLKERKSRLKSKQNLRAVTARKKIPEWHELHSFVAPIRQQLTKRSNEKTSTSNRVIIFKILHDSLILNEIKFMVIISFVDMLQNLGLAAVLCFSIYQ